jgi:hypothetical protein
MKILTLEEVKAQGLEYLEYDKDRYNYLDTEGIEHLIHKGIEVAQGTFVYSYSLERYQYTNNDGIKHYIDITKRGD